MVRPRPRSSDSYKLKLNKHGRVYAHGRSGVDFAMDDVAEVIRLSRQGFARQGKPTTFQLFLDG